MNRPTQTPRRTPSASPSTKAAAPPRPVAFSRAPQANATADAARQKPQEPQPLAAAHVRGAGAGAGGSIQAHVVGGTRALHARLVAMHAAEQRASASRAATQGFGGAQRDASNAVQCKRSFGVDAFRVSLQPKTGGQPLPSEVRAKMETAFGADFSDVRVHVGHEASRIGAIAYTWGSNIHFAPGHYNPHTLQGQKVLGHELWHVVQQKSGRVKNPFGGGVAVVQDHALEAEADRMGEKAALTSVLRKSG
ncbi:MAG TPA: DUF4157 domain-containing protein [Pyrinomonadaceae bacterium]|nr:DUF4157 domain-containing protein [Pyrinomonadaceae bacterium]